MSKGHSHPVLDRRRNMPKAKQAPPPVPDSGQAPRPASQRPDLAGKAPPVPVPVFLSRARAEESGLADVTVVVVNYETPGLLLDCVDSLLAHYPDITVLLVDNGSGESSQQVATGIVEKHANVSAVFNGANLTHGPALHQGMRLASTRYVLTLDTDCIIERAGFIEQMLAHLLAEGAYATGWVRCVAEDVGVSKAKWKDGDAVPDGFCRYAHPSTSLYDREVYMELPPFGKSGAPATRNMKEARNRGLKVVSFPVGDYVNHLVAGTRRMWDGRWDPKPGEEAGPWKEEGNWPI